MAAITMCSVFPRASRQPCSTVHLLCDISDSTFANSLRPRNSGVVGLETW